MPNDIIVRISEPGADREGVRKALKGLASLSEVDMETALEKVENGEPAGIPIRNRQEADALADVLSQYGYVCETGEEQTDNARPRPR